MVSTIPEVIVPICSNATPRLLGDILFNTNWIPFQHSSIVQIVAFCSPSGQVFAACHPGTWIRWSPEMMLKGVSLGSLCCMLVAIHEFMLMFNLCCWSLSFGYFWCIFNQVGHCCCWLVSNIVINTYNAHYYIQYSAYPPQVPMPSH